MSTPSSHPAQAWYTVRSLFPGVYRIAERGVNCYLVCGTERALLIDTGWGFGDLAGVVASLTTLPVSVVLTHGHPDHIYGAQQFAEASMSAADMPMVAFMLSEDAKRNMLERMRGRGPMPDWFSPESWINAPQPTLQALPEQAAYNLGGRTLQIIPTAGHTPGSLCLLDADAHLLFTGDSIVSGTILMFLEQSLPLHVYDESLQHLLSLGDSIDTLLPGHAEQPLPASYIADIHAGVTAILQGTVTGEPEQTFLGVGLCARFDNFAICYKADRL
jgi:glyoxylase-like metal-dependent hydrolase (beta-lactamase superfamily II)